MFSKAVSKLNLTNTVIEEGRFSLLDQAQSGPSGLQVSAGFPGKVQIFSTFSSHLLSPQLSEILKVGVDQLLSSEESSVQEVKLEKILGLSEGGQWLDDEELISNRGEEEEEQEEDSDSYKSRFHLISNCSLYLGLRLVFWTSLWSGYLGQGFPNFFSGDLYLKGTNLHDPSQ